MNDLRSSCTLTEAELEAARANIIQRLSAPSRLDLALRKMAWYRGPIVPGGTFIPKKEQ